MRRANMIPYGRQDVTREDIQAVQDILSSDLLTQGPVVPLFENKISTLTGAKYVTAVNSATSALHISCLSLGVVEGDFVWTVPNTFVASANCALYCGASVDFVDIDINTANMSVDCLKQKLISAKQEGNLPKVVIPVHFAGEPCDMLEVKKLSDQYGFKIIEDASHAIGGKYKDRPIGSCEFSDITVFSFHPVKIVTSGEGGAATTNCPDLDRKLKLLRSHGISRDRDLMIYPRDDAWYYEQVNLGYNYRMTDIHAALGLSQLTRLYSYVERRHKIAWLYDKEFLGTCIHTPYRNRQNRSALHLYVIQIDSSEHKRVFDALREQNIGVNVHYIPVHTQPYYQKFGFDWGDFPVSENFYRQAISLPIFPTLADREVQFVIQRVKEALDA